MDKLTEDKLKLLTNETNRSLNQTKFLFELLNDDFEKLVLLEEKIKNNFISFCPSSLETVVSILNMRESTTRFSVSEDCKNFLFDKEKV